MDGGVNVGGCQRPMTDFNNIGGIHVGGNNYGQISLFSEPNSAPNQGIGAETTTRASPMATTATEDHHHRGGVFIGGMNKSNEFGVSSEKLPEARENGAEAENFKGKKSDFNNVGGVHIGGDNHGNIKSEHMSVIDSGAFISNIMASIGNFVSSVRPNFETAASDASHSTSNGRPPFGNNKNNGNNPGGVRFSGNNHGSVVDTTVTITPEANTPNERGNVGGIHIPGDNHDNINSNI